MINQQARGVAPLVKVVETCAACPSQWDAWTATGQYLYLRYRWGVGTVDAFDGPDSDQWGRYPDGSVAKIHGTCDMDGDITLTDFLAAAGLELAPDAEVRPLFLDDWDVEEPAPEPEDPPART